MEFSEISSETRDLLRNSQEDGDWTRDFVVKAEKFKEISEVFFEIFLKQQVFPLKSLKLREKIDKNLLLLSICSEKSGECLENCAFFLERLENFLAVCFVGFFENLCERFLEDCSKKSRFSLSFPGNSLGNSLAERARLGNLVISYEKLGFLAKNSGFQRKYEDFEAESEEDAKLKAILLERQAKKTGNFHEIAYFSQGNPLIFKENNQLFVDLSGSASKFIQNLVQFNLVNEFLQYFPRNYQKK